MGTIISVTNSGSALDNAQKKLQKLQDGRWILAILNKYGSAGVESLAAATPKESGETASSWYFTTGSGNGQYWLDFHNRHVEEGVPIAIIIDYGHGTGTGGWIQGRPYIMGAVQPIFDKIMTEVRKEVAS